MRIVFPEINNPVVANAILMHPEIEAVPAMNLDEACVKLADADAMIAGIDYDTREVVLACNNNLEKNNRYFSSCNLMKKDDQKIIVADAGICRNPDEDLLKAIILQTYDSAKKILDTEPCMAILSFSTAGSGGKDESIDRARAVLAAIRAENPNIKIDGEMQLDAAINPEVARKKMPNSPVAGRANVLICPDLNSGNILYKSMERFGGWTTAGPLIQGFTKPISDLSRGSSVEDVALTIDVIKRLIGE